MDHSASVRTYTVAELLQKLPNSDQRRDTPFRTQMELSQNQQCLHCPLPSLMKSPMQTHIQAQGSHFGLNFLPGICPYHFSLQPLSPGAKVQPALTPPLPGLPLSPCSPQESCWLDMSPISSTPKSRFSLSPCVLVPCGLQFLPPQSLLLLTEAHPDWCICPHAVPIHHPSGPSLWLREASAGEPVRKKLNLTPEPVVSGEQQNEDKSEEKLQKNKDTKFNFSPQPFEPLPSLDEESLAECAFEEYMIMDSLCPKIPQSHKAKEARSEEDKVETEEKLEIENDSFLEKLDELCSDEDFVRKVSSILNIDYLDSLLSSEQLDLLTLGKHEQEELDTIHQELSSPPSADSNSQSTIEETSPATPCVKERAQSSVLDSAGTQCDSTAQSSRNIESKKGGPSCSPLLPSLLLEETLPTDTASENYIPINALSTPHHYEQLFMDCSFTSSLHSSDISLTSSLEARDSDGLGALFLSGDSSQDMSEDTSVPLENLADTQSESSSLKMQRGPLPDDAAEYTSRSSDSRLHQDPLSPAGRAPAPSFRSDLLTDSPPALSVLAWKKLSHTLPQMLAHMKDPEKDLKSIKNNSHLQNVHHPHKDQHNHVIPVPASLSYMTGSCDPSESNTTDLELDKQIFGGAKEKLASFAVSVGTREEYGEGERKCENNLEKGVTTVTQKATCIKAREDEMNKANENQIKGTTNTNKIRCSQRLAGQTENEKAMNSEFMKEGAEKGTPKEKTIRKAPKFVPEKDGVIYEKQKRQSSGERQLCKEESNSQQSKGTKTNTAVQFSRMGNKEQYQKYVGEKLRLETREQCDASSSNLGSLIKTPEAKKEMVYGRVKSKDEGTQITSFERRILVGNSQLTACRARRELKFSPKRKVLDKLEVNLKESANKKPVSSPKKKSTTDENRETASTTRCGLPDFSPLNESESKDPISSVKSFEKHLKLPPSLCPELIQPTQKQNTTVELREGGADKHNEAKTCNFYSLRSSTHKSDTSKRAFSIRGIHKATEDTHSSPTPSPDQTGNVKSKEESTNRGETEHTSLTSSPVKRYRQEHGASDETGMSSNETDKVVAETEMSRSSPMKRARWKSKAEVMTKTTELDNPTQRERQ